MSEDLPAGAPDPATDPAGVEAFVRAWAAEAVQRRPGTVDADPWRQAFHIQPPVGLLNDPNGLVWNDGVYHVCYQWYPAGPAHGLKLWAHVTSPDLVHWTEQPPALVPSHPYDRNGCYSGSAVVHEGEIRLIYTGNVYPPVGERIPYQCLATLHADGSSTKHPGNPVVPPLSGYGGDVRDPKVVSRDGTYLMALGSRTPDEHGTVLLLRSADLVAWELVGPIAGGSAEPYGHMWECPDLMRIDDRDVLVASPMSDRGEQAGADRYVDITTYSVGVLDGAAGRFSGTPFRRIDHGPDFYAAQSFVDDSGRVLMLAWMAGPDHAGQPDLAVKHPTAANGWVHCLTAPREVTLDGDVLRQWPVAELESLRGQARSANGVRIDAGSAVSPDGMAGALLDIELTATCEPGGTLSVRLRDGRAGRPVVLTLDPRGGTATLDRSRLGTGAGGVFRGSFRPGPSVDARILLDRSSVEAFLDGGRLAMSARIYPSADEGITVEAAGAAATLDLTAWPLAST
jgi:beta-fructofuranosidase